MYHRKSLSCSDCFRQFDFSGGEQELTHTFGYDQPVRCRVCRLALDAARTTVHGVGQLLSGLALVTGASAVSAAP